MALNFLKTRWQKIVLIIFCALILLFLILTFIVNAYWSPILSDRIKKVVETSSNGLYRVDFSDSKLDVLQGKIVVYNLVLQPDTAVYHSRQKQHLAPNNLFEMRIKRLELSHIHPFRLYLHNKLDIGTVVLSRPELHLSYQLNHTKDTTTKDKRTLYQRIEKSLKSIHIGAIAFNDVKFMYDDYSGHKLASSEFKEMNLMATDLLIDSATQIDKSRLLFCKDITAELYNYAGKTYNGLYNYKLKYLRLSTRQSKVDIKGLYLQPVKPTVFFNKSLMDRFTLHVDSVTLTHFDFIAYHRFRIFNTRELQIAGGNFNVFGNPHKSAPKNDRVVTFPHVALQRLKGFITVDTLLIRHLNITYTEYNSNAKQVGEVEFYNTSGRFLNITNNPDSLKRNNICSASLSSEFMRRGKLDVAFKFNLHDEKNSYSYKGHMGPMELQPLNKAAMPLALIKINSGSVKSFDFDIQADRYSSKGPVKLLYNNLKITLLKADTVNDNLKKKMIASIFANLLIIKHDNPDNAGAAPRSFIVRYQRPPDFPFFKTIWNTLLRGIKPCAGVDEKTEQQAKTQMSQQSVKKQERLAKRAARKERRAERRLKRDLKKQQEAEQKGPH
jgi:hypothetical protein